MRVTIVLAICTGLFVAVAAELAIENNETSDNQNDDDIKIYKLDRQCALVGGLCLNVDDCDENHRSTQTGLCPSSHGHNVECCYKFKERKNPSCDFYWGTCMPWCHPRLAHKTTDCGGQVCCTLV